VEGEVEGEAKLREGVTGGITKGLEGSRNLIVHILLRSTGAEHQLGSYFLKSIQILSPSSYIHVRKSEVGEGGGDVQRLIKIKKSAIGEE